MTESLVPEALEDRYYTVREVATIFQVTEYTVRVWINKGLKGKKLAALKTGKSWRTTRQALADWAAEIYDG